MSLLEDVFLEDEAGEARELERVIDGDEFDERPRSRSDSDENSEKDDEAEEDKKRVDPTSAKLKRVIKNPRFVLNPARLTGPRGIQVIPEHFKDFKFKGKGHEREDLDLVLKKLEHWAYRLYPKFQFADCLKKIETLGKKRPVMVQLQKIRSDQITSEETVVQKDSSDEELAPVQEEDEFDKLLQQQIDIARATPAPPSVTKTPFSERPSVMPKATSSPSINDEQRERMLRNRRMAEEKRLARLKQATQQNSETSPKSLENLDTHKKNKSNVINSSDEEDNVVINNVTIEIHNNKRNIQLDSEGKVSNSPNNAKKRSTIDSSDEEMITNQDNDIVELDNERVTATKTSAKNKTVIVIDDENVPNRSVPIASSSCDIVELDDLGYVVSKSPRKTHKNKLNSSSEEETIEIYSDDGKETNSSKLAKKKNSNVIDSDDDALVISENVSIDVGISDHTPKKHRSKIIDSSDDDTAVMTESVAVDVHNKLDSVFDSLKATNTEVNDVISNNETLIEIKSNISDNNIDSNTDSIDDNSKSFENGDKTETKAITSPINKNGLNDTQNGTDDMDVDFSDDF